jgi:hypothetical protein
MAYMVATTQPSVGLSEHKQSLQFHVLSFVTRKDDIEDVRCCCPVVDHQSWQPAELSYIVSKSMV